MATNDRGAAGVILVIGIALILAVGALLVVTQLDKWTCGPPDGVWVEGPDHCMELP